MEENEKALQPGICGVTMIGDTGIEWICVKPVHAQIYMSRKGKTIFSNNPSADKHFYVARWKNRDAVPESSDD